MTTAELEKIFKSIKKTCSYLGKNLHKRINGEIFLSNGETFSYRLPKDSIPTLLGFDIDYIKKLNLCDTESNFGQLVFLTDNMSAIKYGISKDKIDINNFFLDDFIDRQNSFFDNICLNLYDNNMVVKDDNKIFIIKDVIKTDTKTKRKEYKGIGILEMEYDRGYYVPRHTYLYDKKYRDKILKHYMKDKDISFIRYIINDKSINKTLPPEEFDRRLEELETLKEKINDKEK